MKISFKKAKCHVEYDSYLRGSVLKGTVNCGCTSFRSHLTIESDAPREQILRLVQNAKNGCYAEAMIRSSINIESTLEHNGEIIQLKDTQTI